MNMKPNNTPSPDDAVRDLSTVSVPNISDAMAKGLSRPLKYHTMNSAIKPVSRDFKVCGPAYTVRCYPGATYAMEKAIVEAPPGSVIVCDGQGSDAGVLMGGLMSATAQQRGVLGAVIDGAVRDIDDVIKSGFALFARHIVARSGTFAQLGDLQQTICCGGIVVRPGDIVAGDVNGVVVVPAEIASAVARAALALAQWEEQLLNEILKGKTLEQAAALCEKPPVQPI